MSAHRQVQASAGYTIGFIACGASLVSRWQREQFKNDCLLSIFPPNVRAQKWHFLQRNTYISRMGAGILVIEADLKSGTMITAHRALEQGKPLAVLTQPFASLRWAAVKELHDLGAQIIGSARDCVEIMLPEKLEAREKEKTTEVFLQAETDQEKEWISYLLERGGSIFEQDIKENLSLEASESLQNKGIITRQAGVVFLSCMIQS